MTAFTFQPVTPERWPDLERLFQQSAASQEGEPAVCWCMEWRRPRAEWEEGRGEGNRQAMRELIASGQVPGILAYLDGDPIGWCSISPRPQHDGLQAIAPYRNFADASVWLVSCFYISNGARGQGLMAKLLTAGIEYAKQNGARVIEGYPADERVDRSQHAEFISVYWGVASVFQELGFVEVGRAPRDNRPVMRYYLEPRP